MKINVVRQGKNDILQIDDARIIYRNFRGERDTYNRDGRREFDLIIPDEEIKDLLVDLGFNVKIKPAREEGEAPFMHLHVKVGKYANAYLTSGDNMQKLNEETMGLLDTVEIASVNLDIESNDWTMPNGTSGRTAWLRSINVFQKIDRFGIEYNSRNIN